MILKIVKTIIKILIFQCSRLIPKKRTIWIFGSWFGQKFADNPKYLYLYVLNHLEDIDAYWITKNHKLYLDLKDEYPIIYAYSIKGYYYQIVARVAIYSCGPEDFIASLLGGALHINLWHGVPLKKIMYDDKFGVWYKKKNSILLNYLHSLKSDKNAWVVCTSNAMIEIYKTAFNTNNIIMLGQPRNDIFFIENNVEQLTKRSFGEQNIILYMPTHRKSGEETIELTKIFNLEELNNYLEKNNYIMLVKKHFYHGEEMEPDLYKYNNIMDITKTNYDTQELLKIASILITDYSSCFIDYLLLDRKIIFYAYDYKEYLKTDREMYFDYETIIPSKIIRSWDEFFEELKKGEILTPFEIEKYYQKKLIFFDEENIGEVSSKICDQVNRMVV